MMLLVHASPTTLEPYRSDHLGVLCSPRRVYGDEIEGWSWAADNDAYSQWDEGRYRAMLKRIRTRVGCLFVTAPDVVGDAYATRILFDKWLPELRDIRQPIALVAQDGLVNRDVPWDEIDALFIGGTDNFKMGAVVLKLVREAKQRDLWVHMGRVNTTGRRRYAHAIGCDSIDGTSLSWFRDTYLPGAIRQVSSGQQLMLP